MELEKLVMFCSNCGAQVGNDCYFCSICGHKKKSELIDSVPIQLQNSGCEKEIIYNYFKAGYQYEAIVMFLRLYHDINISIRTLKRRLQQYDFRRRGFANATNSDLKNFIEAEIQGPASLRGYRGLWHSLRTNYDIIVPRDTVMRILKDVDPEGTKMRKARRLRRRKYVSTGPNACWHTDGYDKLKPFGFPIHGCIDGYSRRILWLKVTRSNSHPKVAANYYINTLKELSTCPKLLQTDCGTENVLMAAIQSRLQSSIYAHRYSSSAANIRIENWWSHNKKGYTAWLINFFKDMVSKGEFVLGNCLHMELAWYTFSPLLQYELDQVKLQWNTHYIRRTRHTIPGRPDKLYFLPNLSGGQNQGKEVSEEMIETAFEEEEHLLEDASTIINEADEELVEYFTYVLNEEQLPYPPRDWKEGRELFIRLLEISQ